MNRLEIISALKSNDDKKSYEIEKDIVAKSSENSKFYALFDDFVGMLGDKKSYVRTRGFELICSQAKWDDAGKIEKTFDKMVALLYDEKPTVVRRCLCSLHEVAKHRPELRDKLKDAIMRIDESRYKDSMSPLIKKDRDKLLKMIV